MKKLTMILLAAGALSLGTVAGIAATQNHSPEKRVEHMKKALNLTDAQAAQITTIFKQNEPAMKADHDAIKAAAKGSDSQKAAFAKMKADRDQVQSQVKTILTPDQQAKWQAHMAKHEGRGHDENDEKPQAK